MVIRFIHGMGFGITTTTLATVNMSTLPKNRRGEGIGYFSLSTASGTAVGPFLALFITNHFGYNTMFIFCIIFSVAALILTIFVKITEIDLTDEQKERIKRSFRLKDFYEKESLPIAMLMLIAGIGYSGIVSFINSYAIKMNLTKAASFFFVIYAIFLFLGRPIAGKLFDKKGENIVVYPSFVMFAISFILIIFAKSGFIFLLSAVFLALGYGTLNSSMQSIVGKVTPPQRLGLALSTYYICLDGGMGIGPYILGLIVESFGFHIMYMVLAIAVLFVIPVYYFVHGKKASTVNTKNTVA